MRLAYISSSRRIISPSTGHHASQENRSRAALAPGQNTACRGGTSRQHLRTQFCASMNAISTLRTMHIVWRDRQRGKNITPGSIDEGVRSACFAVNLASRQNCFGISPKLRCKNLDATLTLMPFPSLSSSSNCFSLGSKCYCSRLSFFSVPDLTNHRLNLLVLIIHQRRLRYQLPVLPNLNLSQAFSQLSTPNPAGPKSITSTFSCARSKGAFSETPAIEKSEGTG